MGQAAMIGKPFLEAADVLPGTAKPICSHRIGDIADLEISNRGAGNGNSFCHVSPQCISSIHPVPLSGGVCSEFHGPPQTWYFASGIPTPQFSGCFLAARDGQRRLPMAGLRALYP